MEATTTTMDPGDGEGAMASRSINGDGGAAAKVIREEKKADGFVNGGAAVDTDGPKEPVVVDEAPVIGNGKAAEEEVIKEEDREDAEEELKETAGEEEVIKEEHREDAEEELKEEPLKEAKAAPLKEVKEDEQEEQVADIDANEEEEQVSFAEPEESKETEEDVKEADVEQTDQVAVEEKHAVQEKQDQVAIGEAGLDEKDADVPGEEVVKLAVEEDPGQDAVDEREVKVVAVEQHVPVPEEKITNYQGEEKLADKVVEAKAQAVPQADHSHIVEAIALEAANLDGFGGGAAAGDKTDEIEIIADEFIPDNAEANGDGSSSPRPNGGEVLEKKSRTRGLWSRCFPEFERPDPYSWTSAVALGVIAACSVVVISKHLRSLNANSNA